MGKSDRPYIFKYTHECGSRNHRYCGDCVSSGKWRRRFTSKARRRDARLECKQ